MSNGNNMAFPVPSLIDDSFTKGLTKRELIAAMMAQGFVTKHVTIPAGVNDEQTIHEIRAQWAVAQADALLAELAKGTV